MEKFAFVFIGENENKYKKLVLEHVKKHDIEVKVVSDKEDTKAIFDATKMVLSNIVNRAIILDDFGNLPFMVAGKMKNAVVAQISDEHSAHMTSEHNGSNILVIGTHVTGQETILNILDKYITTPFAAGRHLVRTDMLQEMLICEKEYK